MRLWNLCFVGGEGEGNVFLKIRVYVMKYGGGCCCGNLCVIFDGCDVCGQFKGVILFIDGFVCCVGMVVGSIEEELVWFLNFFWVMLCGFVVFFISCFLGRSLRWFFGYEDIFIFVNEIVCMFSFFFLFYLYFYVFFFMSLI